MSSMLRLKILNIDWRVATKLTFSMTNQFSFRSSPTRLQTRKLSENTTTKRVYYCKRHVHQSIAETLALS